MHKSKMDTKRCFQMQMLVKNLRLVAHKQKHRIITRVIKQTKFYMYLHTKMNECDKITFHSGIVWTRGICKRVDESFCKTRIQEYKMTNYKLS